MEWNNISIYNYGTGTDYISILLGGLYGISFITLTIYGILAEKIRKKAAGIPILILKRYSIIAIFLPTIVLTIYIILMMFYSILEEKIWITILTIVILTYIVFHAIFVLQIFYNPQEVKKRILYENKKKISKVSKQCNHLELEEEIMKQIDEFFPKDNIESNSSNKSDELDIIIDNNDFKDLLRYYLECRMKKEEKNYSKKFCKKIVSIGKVIFKENMVEELIQKEIPYYYVLEDIIRKENFKEYNEFVKIFNSIYDSFIIGEHQSDSEGFINLIGLFCKRIAEDESLLKNLLQLITSDDYNPKDYSYFEMIIKIVITFLEISKISINDHKTNETIKKLKSRELFVKPDYSEKECYVYNSLANLLNGGE